MAFSGALPLDEKVRVSWQCGMWVGPPSPLCGRGRTQVGPSGGSVSTTYQGQRRECREVGMGKTGRSRGLGGERTGTAAYLSFHG